MTPQKLSLFTGVFVALLTLGGLHHVRQGRMHEATRLRTDNDRLRFEASQRRQAASGKTGADVAKPMPGSPGPSMGSDPKPAAMASTDSRVPGTEYRNEGQAGPVSALQTFAWACDHGDAGLMEKLIVFDVAARTNAGEYLASLPANIRSQWASPEAMAAALLISDGINRPFPVAVILAQARVEEVSSERVVLHLPGTGRERSEFQKTPEGWKFAITEAMVDTYLRQAAEQAKGGR